jgi:hypothetical protein
MAIIEDGKALGSLVCLTKSHISAVHFVHKVLTVIGFSSTQFLAPEACKLMRMEW